MSNLKRISIEDLGVELTKMLTQYSEDVKEDVRMIVDANAKKALQELRRISPKKRGKYQKGWKIDEKDTRFRTERKIWNAKHWQLVHLLEHGHIAAGWAGDRGVDRVEGTPHVGPVQEKYGAAIEKQIEEAIIKRGR